jgi:hypothetical protein
MLTIRSSPRSVKPKSRAARAASVAMPDPSTARFVRACPQAAFASVSRGDDGVHRRVDVQWVGARRQRGEVEAPGRPGGR